MIHVTCRLTAKNRDQLRNPTFGNRVWATFTFLMSLRKQAINDKLEGSVATYYVRCGGVVDNKLRKVYC